MDPVESHNGGAKGESPPSRSTDGNSTSWQYQQTLDFSQARLKPQQPDTTIPALPLPSRKLFQAELPLGPALPPEIDPSPPVVQEPPSPSTSSLPPPQPHADGCYIKIPDRPRAQGALFERSLLSEIPGDLPTFARDMGPNVFNWNRRGLRYHEGQVEVVMYSMAHPGNILLSAPTNSGKTVVMLYLAARALAEEKQVVVLAPTKVLCDQIADKAREFLALPPDAIVCLSGTQQEYDKDEREAFYRDSSKRFLVTTAEGFVANAPSIDCRRFGLALIDEVHMMRGDHALVTAVQHLSYDAVRVVGVTASAGEDVAEEETLRRQLNANLHYMRTEPHNVTTNTEIFRASDFHDEYTRQSFLWAAEHLEQTVRERAIAGVKWAILAGQGALANLIATTYFPGAGFRSEFERVRGQSDSREGCTDAMVRILEEAQLRMPFPLRGDEEGADEKSPLGAIEGMVGRIVDEEHKRSSRLSGESKALVSAVYGAAHIPNLYEKLRASGIVSFLTSVAERLIEVRHGVQTRVGAKKRERVPGYLTQLYGATTAEDFGILKAYRALIGDRLVEGEFGEKVRVPGPRLFTALAETSSARTLTEIFPMVDGEGLTDPRRRTKYFRRLLQGAISEVAQMGWAWRNSPKEERMIQNIQEYFSVRGKQGSLLVYSNDTVHARYLSEILSTRLAHKGITATYIVGSSRLKRSSVHENLTAFREGRSQILVMTDVGKLGLDISSVERLEIYGPPWLGRDLIQLRGRVRHNGSEVPMAESAWGKRLSLAHVNTYVVAGTLDQFRDRKSGSGLQRYFDRVRGVTKRGEEIPF